MCVCVCVCVRVCACVDWQVSKLLILNNVLHCDTVGMGMLCVFFLFGWLVGWFFCLYIFHPNEYHMDLCNHLCSFVHPSCMAKMLMLDIMHEPFNQTVIPVIRIGAIDLYHFIPF